MDFIFKKNIWKAGFAAGWLSIILHIRLADPWIAAAAVMSVLLLGYAGTLYGKSRFTFFYPWTAGLLLWAARLTYWDRFEFASRVNNLLLLCMAACFLVFFSRLRLGRKILTAFNRMELTRRCVIIFAASALIFIMAVLIISSQGISLVGDEAHYLIIAQSVARDGDLNVANQYYERQYRDFLPGSTLGIHGYFGKKDPNFEGRRFNRKLPAPSGPHIYSIHLPGLALTLAPFMLFKMNPQLLTVLLRCYMGLFGSLLIVLIYLLILKVWRKRSHALFFAFAAGLSTPLFFHAIHMYPEIQILVLLLAAMYLLLFGKSSSRTLWAGLLLGLLLFWGVKYATFMYLLCGGFFIYFLWKKQFALAFKLAVFPLLCQAVFFAYLYGAYGNFSPMSVYMNAGQKMNFLKVALHKIPNHIRLETLLDYFFDQRDGILLYNPLYFWAFPALFLVFKKIRTYGYHILLALPAGVFVFNYAFLTHRGGHCPQGRPLVPVFWALLMLVIIYREESTNRKAKKILLMLPVYSIFVTLYQVFNPLTLYQTTTHDTPIRSGLMFQLWSPLGLSVNKWLPSFAKVSGNWRYLPNIVILVLFAVLVLLALRRTRGRLRYFGMVLFFLGTGLFVVLPRVPFYNPTAVSAPGVLNHTIYATSLYPRRVRNREFSLEPGMSGTFTFSTPVAAGSLDLVFKNVEKIPASVRVFDRQVKNLHAFKADRVLHIPGPEYKKHRGLYVYRVHVSTGHYLSEPLIFELIPRKR